MTVYIHMNIARLNLLEFQASILQGYLILRCNNVFFLGGTVARLETAPSPLNRTPTIAGHPACLIVEIVQDCDEPDRLQRTYQLQAAADTVKKDEDRIYFYLNFDSFQKLGEGCLTPPKPWSLHPQKRMSKMLNGVALFGLKT